MKEIKAPNKIVKDDNLSIFLAGSIEMDKAENWQNKVIEHFCNNEITFFNPRRSSWDATWKQEISNPKFKEQVEWELDALEQADIIVMYFDPATKSPISLLELGLFANSKKLIVCCPQGFWRKGNVDIVCERYMVEQVENLETLINQIKLKLEYTLSTRWSVCKMASKNYGQTLGERALSLTELGMHKVSSSNVYSSSKHFTS